MSIPSPATGDLFHDQSQPPRNRSRVGVWLLPLALLLGFVLVFALLFRDRLLPATAVAVVPAVGIEEAVSTSTPSVGGVGKMLFQASGWVEPDPLPIKATALTDGVVDEVKVLEGQLVKKGDLLATLIGIDTRLERDAMAAKLEDAKASFDAHCVGTQIQLKEMEIRKAELAAAKADALEAEDKLRRYDRISKGAITEDERNAVRYNHVRALAMKDAAQAKIEGIAEQLNRISYEVLAIQARIKGAETALEKAELAYARTRINAPADGRVLALKAAPGQKKMIAMDDPDSATIAVLYDPEHLQVRVDVPLADAAGLGVGQRAKIRCNLLPDRVFEGEVTRIEGAADLQRNTLQAKVRIIDPSEKLRPEMLCRVEFFEVKQTTTDAVEGGTAVAVYVPEGAVANGFVWICDADSSRAEKRAVESSGSQDGLVRIDSGVRPGEWVVRDPSGIETGQRLRAIFPE